MSFFKEKADGTVVAQPHKLRVMLRDKLQDLRHRYTLDELLSEIAAQHPEWHIHLTPAMENGVAATKPGKLAEKI